MLLWSLLFIPLLGTAQDDVKHCETGTGKLQPGCPELKPGTLKAITYQSSVHKSDKVSFFSKRAIDEDTKTCAKTLELQNSWWRIDLQDVYQIFGISIYNKDFSNHDIGGAEIFIGNSREKNGTTNEKCKQITNLKKDCYNDFRCDRAVSGRYVTVFSGTQMKIILCEVKIYGTKKGTAQGDVKHCETGTDEPQPGRPAVFDQPPLTRVTSQSSIFSKSQTNYSSERAVDGNTTTCAITSILQNSWWRIDLQGVYEITWISIYNKNEHNTDMSGAEIFIGSSREKNGTTNEKCKQIRNFKKDCYNDFRCDRAVSGRYVTVFSGTQKEFILCEVKIYGTKKESPFRLITENKTWEEALDYCRDRNWDLASILDNETQAWAELEAMKANTRFVWLCLRYTCVLDFWFWVDDNALRHCHWAPENPEDMCDMSGAMETTEDHRWFKKSDSEKFNFICADWSSCLD